MEAEGEIWPSTALIRKGWRLRLDVGPVSGRVHSDIKRFRDNMIFRMYDKPNIKVMLNTEATPELIKKMDPFALIIAVGSHPFIPNIPGKDKPIAIDVMQVYDEPEKVVDTVALVGGGLTSCELALHLADEGKKVYIINRRDLHGPPETKNRS